MRKCTKYMRFCGSAVKGLCWLGLSGGLFAQAIVEYAAKSASSAAAGQDRGSLLGGCPLDSALISCINQHYPVAFKVAVVGLCVVGLMMFRKGR